MPKSLLYFLWCLGILNACFIIPPDPVPDPGNQGDGLNTKQLKKVFSLVVQAHWYQNSENDTENPLANLKPENGEAYDHPKVIANTLGDNTNLPNNPIIGITYTTTPASNSQYTSPITIEYIEVTKPDQHKERILVTQKENTYKGYLTLGKQNNTKGIYTFKAFAKRQGHQDMLIYTLPLININVLRNTDEYYYPSMKQAYETNFVLIPKEAYYIFTAINKYQGGGTIYGVSDTPITFNNDDRSSNPVIMGYWWASTLEKFNMGFILSTPKSAWNHVVLTFKIYGRKESNHKERSEEIKQEFFNMEINKNYSFIVAVTENPCGLTCMDTYMLEVIYKLTDIEAFDGKYYTRIHNREDVKKPFIYRLAFTTNSSIIS